MLKSRAWPIVCLLVALMAVSRPLWAQELEPNAYSANPIGVSFLVAAYGQTRGEVLFDPTVNITDVEAAWNNHVLAYGTTFELFGRTANFGAMVPYVTGDISGNVQEEFNRVTRSGFADPRFRFGINLIGNPAMDLAEFSRTPPQTTLGLTFVVAPPVGQYDSSKLVNLGSNRWSIKTELGLSKPIGKWRFEVAAGAWVFTDNDEFFGGSRKSQEHITTVQTHLIYTFKRRAWLAADATWYGGGRSTVDGVDKFDLQSNTRFGLTLAWPINQQHSIKASYNTGVTTRIGGDFDQYALAWQVNWF